jgi:hypothetical protein
VRVVGCPGGRSSDVGEKVRFWAVITGPAGAPDAGGGPATVSFPVIVVGWNSQKK